MTVTQDGRLYGWGAWNNENITEPTFSSAILDPHGRIGRCQALPSQHALALAMGSHGRLGADALAGREQPSEVLSSIVRACRAKPRGPAGSNEGVMRLIGGGYMTPGVRALAAANPPRRSAALRTRSQTRPPASP